MNAAVLGRPLPAEEQDELIEFHFADGVMVKQIPFRRAGVGRPGHKHTYDHTSMLAKGALRIWCDGTLLGDFKAPTGIFIRANAFHTMVALEDDTLLYCIHNTHNFPPNELEQYLVKEKAE
jgi:hypothetical protein